MIKKIIIAGGGTAGWMAAAAFSRLFNHSSVHITLIESDAIGTVGVGEATIPHLRYFNDKLGINEHDFMRATNATFKLGIDFINWGKIGERYIHPFGEFGFPTPHTSFLKYWARADKLGLNLPTDEFSIATHMARKGKFAYPSKNEQSLTSTFSYAFHIDANRYAQYLRTLCENNFSNFNRIEGKINNITQNTTTGNIEALHLEDGTRIEGDFFIDCSGFRSLLVGETLGAKTIDLSKHLPCDRAVAAPTDETYPNTPYSQATAHSAGWQWRIPLKHRTGNGCVYASQFMSDDEALNLFHKNLSGKTLATPQVIKFKASHKNLSWSHNCAAVGLSSGFIEPLESTGIHLIQTAIIKLIELLPSHADYTHERIEFNRQMADEYEKIRDFIILHYRISERDDSEFWRYIKNMELPDSLKNRLALLEETGIVDTYQHGLFLESSWAYVFLGQGGQIKSNSTQTHHLSDRRARAAITKIQR
ncbi:MAG: tryptophan halogenase family protein [Marinagarivorans sp.]|nr:tryptophan halogenase family protein [Marinagarivorans sp.]